MGCTQSTKLSQLKDLPATPCSICFEVFSSSKKVITLECGHTFHFGCIDQLLRKGLEKRIGFSFGFSKCPECRQDISHPAFVDQTRLVVQLKKLILVKAEARLLREGLEKCDAITNPASEWFERPQAYALHHYTYSLCKRCKNPYFYGTYECQAAGLADEEKKDEEEKPCERCVGVVKNNTCSLHGKDFLIRKCECCCEVASFNCYYYRYFCLPCHDDIPLAQTHARSGTTVCKGKECPLYPAPHPPPSAFKSCVLRCAKCE